MLSDSEIVALADTSPIETYPWKDQGPAKKAYIRGMAVAFARGYALLRSADDGSASKKAVARATAGPIGDSAHDALAWYANELSAAGATTGTEDARLVSLFAILLGLGMRESSGKHCCGADTPDDRGAPTTEDNAEAGLFQVSHDSIGHNALRQSLFDEFQGRRDLLDIFKVDIHCSDADLENHGVGAGARFQETMKQCPLFAALFAAMFLREQRKHWGPVNRKEAEVKADAVALFKRVQTLLDTSAS